MTRGNQTIVGLNSLTPTSFRIDDLSLIPKPIISDSILRASDTVGHCKSIDFSGFSH